VRNFGCVAVLSISLLISGCLESDEDKLEKAFSLYPRDASDQSSIKQAREIFESLSLENNAKAQYMLAQMYMRGDGVVRDMDKALELLLKSSANGNGDASYYASRFYLEEKFGQKLDEAYARDLLKKAARDGSDIGRLRLGIYYMEGGIGFIKDLSKAMAELKSVKDGEYRLHAALRLFHFYTDKTSEEYSPEKAMKELGILADANVPIFEGLLAAAYTGRFFNENVESVRDLEKYNALISRFELDKKFTALAVATLYANPEITGKKDFIQAMINAIRVKTVDPMFASVFCKTMAGSYLSAKTDARLDYKDLVRACTFGAEANDSYQQYVLAAAYYKLKNYEEAYKWALISTMSGNESGLALARQVSLYHLDARVAEVEKDARDKFENIKDAPPIHPLPPGDMPWYASSKSTIN